MIFTRVVPPAEAPVTLAEVKQYLRIEHGDEDMVLTGLVAAVTAHLDGREGVLNKALVTQTWEVSAGIENSAGIEIDFGPVQEVVEVAYRSGGGYVPVEPEEIEMIRTSRGRTLVRPPAEVIWPTPDTSVDAWRLMIVAGYGGPDAVPDDLKAVILLLVGDLYENRGAKTAANQIVNPTLARLLWPHQDLRVG